MALIKNLKPAVAAIPNEAQRKRAADSLAILIKGSMQQDAQYGELMQMRQVVMLRKTASLMIMYSGA